MTKKELFLQLENVPDDTIIILSGGNMEKGHVMEELVSVSTSETWKKEKGSARDAFDGGTYSYTYWTPCSDKEEGSERVVRLR